MHTTVGTIDLEMEVPLHWPNQTYSYHLARQICKIEAAMVYILEGLNYCKNSYGYYFCQFVQKNYDDPHT